MLTLGDDWKFELEANRSKVWLNPKGLWGMKITCKATEVKTIGGLPETFSPTLNIEGLRFDGDDWRELVGIEIKQHGAWRGDGDPEAILYVETTGDIYESTLKIVDVDGTALVVELDGIGDIFVDDRHDTNCPVKLRAKIEFEGVRFRFRAEGTASLDPGRKAAELLSATYDLDGFGEPEITKLKPGTFTALFPPVAAREDLESGEQSISAEVAGLRKSATELLTAFVKQEWLELEDGGVKSLVPDFVDVMAVPDRGAVRAERIAEWFMERDEVVDLHCSDEDLGAVLDKWW